MALPRKSGLRKIRVGAIEYYWTWRTDYASKTIRIRVGEVQNQNKCLLIQAYHIDAWLQIGETETKRNEIDIVTPGFIRSAIDFALSSNWEEEKKQRLHLKYDDKEFKLKDKESFHRQSPSTNTNNPDAKTRSA